MERPFHMYFPPILSVMKLKISREEKESTLTEENAQRNKKKQNEYFYDDIYVIESNLRKFLFSVFCCCFYKQLKIYLVSMVAHFKWKLVLLPHTKNATILIGERKIKKSLNISVFSIFRFSCEHQIYCEME